MIRPHCRSFAGAVLVLSLTVGAGTAQPPRPENPYAPDGPSSNPYGQEVRPRQELAPAEVLSGEALNELLREVIARQAKGEKGPNVPLDAARVQRLNLTGGQGRDPSLLRDGGRLTWPPALQAAAYDRPRREAEQRFRQAVDAARGDRAADRETLARLREASETLQAALAADVDYLTPSQYIEARRYLNRLDSACRLLQDADARDYFSGKWAARGDTVAALVDHMKRQGLRFAPAAPGDEDAYRALYAALRAYEAGLAPPP